MNGEVTSGTGLEDLSMELVDEHHVTVGRAFVDGDRWFQFRNVAPGTYTLRAVRSDTQFIMD